MPMAEFSTTTTSISVNLWPFFVPIGYITKVTFNDYHLGDNERCICPSPEMPIQKKSIQGYVSWLCIATKS